MFQRLFGKDFLKTDDIRIGLIDLFGDPFRFRFILVMSIGGEIVVIGGIRQYKITHVKGRKSNFLLHNFPFATTMRT